MFKYLKMFSICIRLHDLVSLAHPASHMWIKLEALDGRHAQAGLCADMAPFDRAQEHVPRGGSIWVTLFPRRERPLIWGYWRTPPNPTGCSSVPFNVLNQQTKPKLERKQKKPSLSAELSLLLLAC